jgi:hypothetical protein
MIINNNEGGYSMQRKEKLETEGNELKKFREKIVNAEGWFVPEIHLKYLTTKSGD